MARKKLTVKTTVVSVINGERIERAWDDIPEEERKMISWEITDRFMEAAGYHKEGRETIESRPEEAPSQRRKGRR